jgi:hypothetical protein
MAAVLDSQVHIPGPDVGAHNPEYEGLGNGYTNDIVGLIAVDFVPTE